jgi:hypothetical protein
MEIDTPENALSVIPEKQMELYKGQIENVISLFDPNQGHRALMIMDVDQTVLDSLGEYFFGGQERLIEEIDKELETVVYESRREELEQWRNEVEQTKFEDLGDEHGAFIAFDRFPHNRKVNDELVQDVNFHEDMQLMEENIPYIMQRLQKTGVIPGLYLSARPNEVADVTKQRLRDFNCFPEGTELMTRDFGTMKWDITNEWKAWVISEVAKGIKAKGGRVVVMDDNIELISFVEQISNETDNIIPLLMDSWTRTDERLRHVLVRWSIEEGDKLATGAGIIEEVISNKIHPEAN